MQDPAELKMGLETSVLGDIASPCRVGNSCRRALETLGACSSVCEHVGQGVCVMCYVQVVCAQMCFSSVCPCVPGCQGICVIVCLCGDDSMLCGYCVSQLDNCQCISTSMTIFSVRVCALGSLCVVCQHVSVYIYIC